VLTAIYRRNLCCLDPVFFTVIGRRGKGVVRSVGILRGNLKLIPDAVSTI